MHSMHGLFRSKNLELGRNEDTGGQIVYVLELAKALGQLSQVDKVDIITRRLIDTGYPGYSKKIEKVSDKVSIIRIECGPEKYIRKVELWPYLPQFIENVKKYIRKIRRAPDILHSNYADSGLVCSILSEELGIPQVHTGHSLGIPKMKRLGVNHENARKFNKVFHFDKRIKAEQKVIDHAKAIIASTNEEIREQYSGYKIKRHMAKFRLITPGIDLNKFHPPSKHVPTEKELSNRQLFQNIIDQNLKYRKRAIITTLSRLDKRKNIYGLIKAYAHDPALKRMANLVIFAETLIGGPEEQKIISKINSTVRKTNLYEHIAMPAVHLEYETQVPDYYRFIAEKKGVFINPALIEPFGLTVIEAMASGAVVVATKHGGPSEIIKHGVNGFLVDPKKPKEMAKLLRKIIRNRQLLNKVSKNGAASARKKYAWETSAKKYLTVFREALKK